MLVLLSGVDDVFFSSVRCSMNDVMQWLSLRVIEIDD